MAPPRRRGNSNNNAAALRAARRRNRGCGEESDEDDLPPLGDEKVTSIELKQQIQEIDEDDSDDENLRCLHCQAESTEIQVQCDECSAYICDSCHWCHEFQANHEIRVCDRCDASFCRGCDEMDQCDDCAEVVCASCSTLLSCKFCGGGLCEECATACGRYVLPHWGTLVLRFFCPNFPDLLWFYCSCGIVLCSRDAKFAVDCDTCRLSYCLVCLASGAKDPCVRCGTRPSKRMEQLVHLRLKSIYKAFKQNSSSTAKSPNTRERQNDDPDEDHVADDPEALFQAAASAAKNSPQRSKSRSKHHKRSDSADSSSTVDQVNRFKKEKEKADAAAAALLAELEEEEEAEKCKIKKKMKKKARQHAKKDDDPNRFESAKNDCIANEVDVNDLSSTEDVSRGDSGDWEAKPPPEPCKINSAIFDSKHRLLVADPMERELCNLVASEDMDGLEKMVESIKGIPGRSVLRKNAKKALKRLRHANCFPEEEDDEEITDTQLKVMEELPTYLTGSRMTTPVAEQPFEPNGFLKILSHTHNKPSSHCATPGSHHGPNFPRSRGSNTGGLKSECVMHMAPGIVGWVIGKGGQRIRDLMEESGARIWIDQDSMGSQDPRLVYVSGQRKNVDLAVEMVQDLVLRAPTITSPLSRQATPLADPLCVTIRCSTVVSQAPSVPDAADATEVLLKPKTGHSVFSELLRSSSRSSGVAEGRTRHIMTCDPRFVPLLIGRRGWTIKNIQDSTGAKVDIDQSVNPRKISISGNEENVEKAIIMVRDVLSYPQAQLQGYSDEDAQPVPSFQNSAGISPYQHGLADKASTLLQRQVPSMPLSSAERSKANGTPPTQLSPSLACRVWSSSPPSSLIMAGDAKSTISASSSLSSTPEPIIQSSRSHFAQIAPGPMMSPPQNGEIFTSACNDLPQYTYSQRHLNSSMAGPPAHPQCGNDILIPRNQCLGRHQLSDQSGQGTHSGHPLQNSNYISQERPTFLPGIPSAFGPMSNQNNLPTVFQPSRICFPAHSGPGDPHLVRQNNFDKSGNDRVGVAPAFWNGLVSSHGHIQGSANHVLHGSDSFHLDAAVEFLEHSTQHSTTISGVVRRKNEIVGFANPVGVEQSLCGQDPLIGFQKVRDDAQMVDSLFGPAGNVDNESSLLTGLQGLSLNVDGVSTGMWGSSNATEGGVLKGLATVGAPANDAMLFARIQPTLSVTERKSQSRFAWGESGGR